MMYIGIALIPSQMYLNMTLCFTLDIINHFYLPDSFF